MLLDISDCFCSYWYFAFVCAMEERVPTWRFISAPNIKISAKFLNVNEKWISTNGCVALQLHTQQELVQSAHV